jgi:hypothetical protein
MPPYDPYAPPPEEDEEEHPQKPQAPSALSTSKGATHSNLDALIDAVSGKAPVRRITCEKCGGESFRTFSPLEGGVRMRVCRKCKVQVPMASVATAAPVPIPHSQFPQGPYAGPPMPSMQMLRETKPFRLRSLMEDMANEQPTSEDPFGRR